MPRFWRWWRKRVIRKKNEVDHDETEEEVQSLEHQVVAFLESRDVVVRLGSFAACHSLPRKT